MNTRPAHLLLALIESEDRAVSAITKLGHDSFQVLRGLEEGLRHKTPGHKRQEKRENGQQPVAEKEEKPKKPTALERFGRDLTALAAEGALSPCQWVAKGKRHETPHFHRSFARGRDDHAPWSGSREWGRRDWWRDSRNGCMVADCLRNCAARG